MADSATLNGVRGQLDSLSNQFKQSSALLIPLSKAGVLLDQYRRGSGWVTYTALTKAQVKELSDSVNALSEPLSKLTAAVTL